MIHAIHPLKWQLTRLFASTTPTLIYRFARVVRSLSWHQFNGIAGHHMASISVWSSVCRFCTYDWLIRLFSVQSYPLRLHISFLSNITCIVSPLNDLYDQFLTQSTLYRVFWGWNFVCIPDFTVYQYAEIGNVHGNFRPQILTFSLFICFPNTQVYWHLR